MKRVIWRWLLKSRYWIFQRHRYDRLVLERVGGRLIVVLPQVFNPKLFRTGAFLAEALNPALIPPESLVLDMGTGSGLLAVVAAQWARRVVAVDINPEAVRCARLNALLSHAQDRVHVCQGDLFNPVASQRFDVVLFNPPYYHGTPQDALDHAWRSENVVDRFAAGLRDHLLPSGYALVVLSSDGESASFLESFRLRGFKREIVATRDFINEVLTVYKFSN